MIPCFFLQVRNPTNALGRAAHGSLLVPMNWRGISASTQGSNPSSAQTVTAAFHVPTTLLCTESATCSSECPSLPASCHTSVVVLGFFFYTQHFHLDSAGLNLWVYTIKSLHMVSNILSNPSISLPRVRPKECEHFYYFFGVVLFFFSSGGC